MTPSISYGRIAAIFLSLASSSMIAACSGADEAAQGKQGARGPVQVGFITVQQASVPIIVDLGGRVNASETSEVRPQVAGIIRQRFFTEGALVRQGQTLYRIDPRLYSAAVNEARANLQSARANAEATRARADRYRPLAEIEAVAQQDYTDANASARQAAATVAQTSAQLETAQVNLSFTNVPAPITGRIGRSLATVGALVTASQAEPLAVIQRLDPIYVDIQQSSADLLALRRALATDGVAPASATVRLRLEDGSSYGPTGTVEFAEVMVNESTGTVTLRARFPNPLGLLLPGMFVRATFAQAIDTHAYLVPQQAVLRDAKGAATVYVVGPNNRAIQRSVVADRTQGANWVVTRGLNSGDRVIVQGVANLKPNADIKPVPATSEQRIVAPAGNSPGGGANARTKSG